jgi:hypothetical protein
MTGLDPVTHAVGRRRARRHHAETVSLTGADRCCGAAWVAGSSPAMTEMERFPKCDGPPHKREGRGAQKFRLKRSGDARAAGMNGFFRMAESCFAKPEDAHARPGMRRFVANP